MIPVYAVEQFKQGDKFVDNKDGSLTKAAFNFILRLFQRTGMQSGVPATVGSGLTASGTTQVTALLLKDDINEVATGANNSGVQLFALQPGQRQQVINVTGNTIKIYPASGSAIDALGANAAYSLSNGKSQMFTATSQTQLRSMQLG